MCGATQVPPDTIRARGNKSSSLAQGSTYVMGRVCLSFRHIPQWFGKPPCGSKLLMLQPFRNAVRELSVSAHRRKTTSIVGIVMSCQLILAVRLFRQASQGVCLWHTNFSIGVARVALAEDARLGPVQHQQHLGLCFRHSSDRLAGKAENVRRLVVNCSRQRPSVGPLVLSQGLQEVSLASTSAFLTPLSQSIVLWYFACDRASGASCFRRCSRTPTVCSDARTPAGESMTSSGTTTKPSYAVF